MSDAAPRKNEPAASMAIPIGRLPHLHRLAADYFSAFDKVKEFFNGDFRDPDAFRLQADKVRARDIPRDRLAEILAEQNRAFGCGPATLDNIEKIVRERACAVVTGQQVGLFSGPLYTVYKALTAIKLAERLSGRGLGPVVPIFWPASDDHDLAEIDHIVLPGKEGGLREIRCPAPARESKLPVAMVPLPEDIRECLRGLADGTRDSEFKPGVLAGLEDAYRPGRSWAEAFARWMTGLFASRGLIFIDPADPRLKELGRDVFIREIAAKSAATPPALAASERLRRAGYGEQIRMHEGILNVFFAERERLTIHVTGESFEIKAPPRQLAFEELLELARARPALFSPNVLLRPIYQDALLPTVAYVGGPGEIAYFAQMKGVYDEFALPMPIVYPRRSATILEDRIGRILGKFGLGVDDFWRDAAGILGGPAKARIPDGLGRALDAARADTERDLESLSREIQAFEPTLGKSVHLARGKLNQQWNFLERKIDRAAAKRNDIAARQVRTASDNLYPNGSLQERVFNVVPYLIKYGPAFMDRLDEALDVEDSDHRIVRPG